MADADVIPIGSGGRPGRGSRRTTPSAVFGALRAPLELRASGGSRAMTRMSGWLTAGLGALRG
ncbi:hypothetical protein [Kribbella sp. NPDC055071]